MTQSLLQNVEIEVTRRTFVMVDECCLLIIGETIFAPP